jgi:hypothetical protein
MTDAQRLIDAERYITYLEKFRKSEAEEKVRETARLSRLDRRTKILHVLGFKPEQVNGGCFVRYATSNIRQTFVVTWNEIVTSTDLEWETQIKRIINRGV